MLGKEPIIIHGEPQDYGHCEYCFRSVGQLPEFKWCSPIKKKYSHYGPNVVLYLEISRRIIAFMILCFLLFTIPSIAINFSGNGCQAENNHC